MLSDGMWRGERVFVVGGGPSLRGFDWERLRGERCIAVNRAYEDLPRAVLLSMCLGFWKEHGGYVAKERARQVRAFSSPHVSVHVRVGDEKLPAFGPSHIVPCCADLSRPNPHLEACWGTSLSTGLGCGGNSGFAAVNLADVLGAKTIYLLGFDMRPHPVTGRTCNYHDGYDQPPQDGVVYHRMRLAFDDVRTDIRARVVNLNCQSALRVFPYENPDKVI